MKPRNIAIACGVAESPSALPLPPVSFTASKSSPPRRSNA